MFVFFIGKDTLTKCVFLVLLKKKIVLKLYFAIQEKQAVSNNKRIKQRNHQMKFLQLSTIRICLVSLNYVHLYVCTETGIYVNI